MKILISIPFAAMVLLSSLLTSCEKEEPLSEAIIGKWEVTDYKYIIYENNVRKSEITIFMEADEMEIQFADGGAGLIYEGGELAGNFEWTLSGSTLTVIMGVDPMTWEITINDDILVWTYTESEIDGDVTFKYEFFYTAKKSL